MVDVQEQLWEDVYNATFDGLFTLIHRVPTV